DLGCALHHALLPGGGIRAGRTDHASDRRADAGRRFDGADRHLSAYSGAVFRRWTEMNGDDKNSDALNVSGKTMAVVLAIVIAALLTLATYKTGWLGRNI